MKSDTYDMLKKIHKSILLLNQYMNRVVYTREINELTVIQYLVLYVVCDKSKEEVNITDIANELGTTRQNVHKILRLLKQKGYVNRSFKKDDKKSVVFVETEQGRNTLVENEVYASKTVEAFTMNYTKNELETLFNLLEKLNGVES